MAEKEPDAYSLTKVKDPNELFRFSAPDFETGKHYLEANDSAGNTFKATAKPVLIGTAVVGATTMIFAIILLLSLWSYFETRPQPQGHGKFRFTPPGGPRA